MDNPPARKRRKTEGGYSENASTRKEMVRRDKLSQEQFQKDKIRRNTNSAVFQARKKLKGTATFAQLSPDEQKAALDRERERVVAELATKMGTSSMNDGDATMSGGNDESQDLVEGLNAITLSPEEEDKSAISRGKLKTYWGNTTWESVHWHWFRSIYDLDEKIAMLKTASPDDLSEKREPFYSQFLRLLSPELLQGLNEPPLPHQFFTVGERAIIGNRMLWDMTDLLPLEPFLDKIAPDNYVFANHFKPNKGQSEIEAFELYCIFSEPPKSYQGFLFDELAWQGLDVRAQFLPRLVCNKRGPLAGYGPAEGVLRYVAPRKGRKKS
ncbi:hypothetical protein KC345_g6548 [Hortaea werneckii]|nr:hypothetical protein KC345_g6548 [Hortaea werneckii]